MTIALKVAYKGAAFSGFARQPELLTVQGELERALVVLFHRIIETTCAGRTDTGVHAIGQVVSFEIFDEDFERLELRRFKRSLNAITHEDIAVKDVWRAPDGFSARFDALVREYRYFMAVNEVPPVFMRDFSWHVGSLDVVAMERASRYLIGEKDFKSFCRTSSAVGRPTCRNLMEVSLFTQDMFGEEMLVMRVLGSSFLHSMVRTLVGTLVEVGRSRRSEEWVAEVLAARDRAAAGECAPACGLVFWDVRYD